MGVYEGSCVVAERPKKLGSVPACEWSNRWIDFTILLSYSGTVRGHALNLATTSLDLRFAESQLRTRNSIAESHPGLAAQAYDAAAESVRMNMVAECFRIHTFSHYEHQADKVVRAHASHVNQIHVMAQTA